MQKKQNDGFSIVEIVIVLLIIGLIISATMAGQQFIHHSNMLSIIKDLKTMDSAYEKFQDIYAGLPGDLNNADDQFSGNCGDLSDVDCDGNGDGILSEDERLKAWVHMASAKLIDGNFTGEPVNEDIGAGSVDNYGSLGKNVPISEIKGAGYVFDMDSDYWEDIIHLRLGTQISTSTSSQTHLEGSALTPIEIMEIDNKMDDGKIFTGKIRAQNGNGASSNCYTSFSDGVGTNPTGDFNGTVEDVVCMLTYFFDKPTPQ